MGTKKNPAPYDCYTNADPNEPMFILLGRDLSAAGLVEDWALRREVSGEDPAMVREAYDCAAAMRAWATETITVCDHCFHASCWQGIFYCDNYKTAGTVQKTRKELKKMADAGLCVAENSAYWEITK